MVEAGARVSNWRTVSFVTLGLLIWASPGLIAEDAQVPGGDAPLLRIIPDGPLSTVTSIALGPDGSTLFAGGWDKVVHVWTLQQGRFVYAPEAAFRVPIGGGLDGSITAIALSDDGSRLAVGGRSAKRSIAGSRESGYVWPGASMGPERWEDEGVIYLFNLRDRSVKTLRGHRGAILHLDFAPTGDNGGLVLVSAAEVWKEGEYRGEIKAWDVERSAAIATIDTMPVQTARGTAQQPFPPVDPTFVPKLASIRTGQRLEDVQVGIAWGDTAFGFRVWELAKQRLTRPATGNQLQCVGSAVGSPASFLFLAGDRTTGIGQIRRIAQRANQELLDIDRSSTILFNLGVRQLPTSTELLPSGRIVATGADLSKGQARLLLIDPNNARTVADVQLWSPLAGIPLLAADASGKFIAVTGNQQDEVLVYGASELAAGRAEPQVLRASADRFKAVEFVTRREHAGLKFTWQRSSSSGSGEDVNVLDLNTGELLSGPDGLSGWTTSAPEPQWTVVDKQPSGNDVRFTLRGPDNAEKSLLIGCSAGERTLVGDSLTIPPGTDCPIPVFVVAVHCGGQPQLRVYNIETGEQIRRYISHTGTIRGLAASADGRLLASVADDRTVCVWTLSDLTKNLGKHGLLRDGNDLLQADTQEGAVVVRDGIPELPTGTKIFSIVLGEERPLSSAWDLYTRVHGYPPGSELVLGTGEGRKTVTVGQAIDERRPLFSLYFPDGQEGQREWIGWSPLGPYDRSSPAAEMHLGWHFNTGDTGKPARFAAVDDYRDTFYTPKLLKELYEKEAIPPRQAAAPPQVSILLEGESGEFVTPDEFSQLLVRRPDATAHVAIGGEFPPDRIVDVQISVEASGMSRPLAAIRESGGDSWSIELGGHQWARGSQRLKVQLVSDERPPRTFEQSAIVRFQPPPPKLLVDREKLVPQDDMLTIALRVIPSQMTPCRVRLAYLDGTGKLLSEQIFKDIQEPADLTHDLQLKPGLGQLEVSAINEGAAYNFAWLERTLEQIPVQYQPKPPSDVKIAIRDVDSNGTVLEATGGIVSAPLSSQTVTVRGTIQSGDPIESAAVAVGDHQATAIELNQTGEKEFQFSVPVSLTPGRQIVRLTARSTKGVEADSELSLEYQPPLPTLAGDTLTPKLTADAPQEQPPFADVADRVTLVAPWHDGTVELAGQLAGAGDSLEGLELAVLVDGVPADVVATRQNDQISATITVPPGRHEIQWRLTNPAGQRAFGLSHSLAFLRPPQLVDSRIGDDVTQGRLSFLTATYKSPQDRPITADRVRLQVNDTPVPIGDLVDVQQTGDAWQVSIRDIPLLVDGDNHLTLTVANADGPALTAAEHDVAAKLKIAAPRIDLADQVPAKVKTATLPVEFAVLSAEPPREVTVGLADRGTPLTLSSESSEPLGDDGLTKFNYSATVTLAAGVNEVVVTAWNSGGQARQSAEVSFTQEPVTVAIDKLGLLVPRRTLDGGIHFDQPSPTSVAVLEGRIQMASSAQENALGTERGQLQHVQLWVNAFKQRTAALTPVEGEPGVFRFSSPLTFNLAEQNLVEVILPERAVNHDSRRACQFYVDCADPDRSQELFLLIIAPGSHREVNREQQERELVEDAFRILEAREENGEWVSPAFSRIRKPVVHVGRFATITHINSALSSIKRAINSIPARQDGSGGTRAALLIYYNGRELRLEKDGRNEFLLATTNNWDRLSSRSTDALSSEYLSSMMQNIDGAHLLALDLETVEGSAEHEWPGNPHLGILRVAVGEQGAQGRPLMSALEQVVPRSRLLRDVADGLRTVLRMDEAIASDIQIPPALERMRFGALPE